MADSIYTFDPVAANNTALDTIPYGPNQLYHNQIDNLFRAFAAKLGQHVDDLGGVNTVGGTANALTATIASGITAYATGQLFWFKNTPGPNTTAATMNVNTIGIKEIRLLGDTALAGGEMLDNGYYGLLYDAAYDGGDGGFALLNPYVASVSAVQPQGQHTIWIPAGAMTAATTNGAASGTGETSSNKVMRKTLDFDTTSEEFAQFFVQMPKSWNEGTLILQAVWSHPSTTTNFGVAWGFEAVAFADDDALDAAWGTEVAVTDTGGTTDDIYITAESGAVTVAGTPAAEEFVAFRVTRVVGNGSDTLAVDARLHGVKVHYTTDANTDS